MARQSAVPTDPESNFGRETLIIPPRLSVRSVRRTFAGDSTPTIQEVSFEVARGEFVALVGPSGCGKSTLLNLIAGLQEPDAGLVLIDGEQEARLGRVGYMQQRDLLLPWRTVMENARLGLEIRGAAKAEADRLVRERAERFGLSGTLHRRPWQLSGGMRQRAALLRATLPQTGVLLLDEPFGALDAITRSSLQEWLQSVMRDNDQAVVLVTHDVDEALLLADRVHVMAREPGRIVQTVHVQLDKPRTSAVMTAAPFLKLKAQLLAALNLQPRVT